MTGLRQNKIRRHGFRFGYCYNGPLIKFSGFDIILVLGNREGLERFHYCANLVSSNPWNKAPESDWNLYFETVAHKHLKRYRRLHFISLISTKSQLKVFGLTRILNQLSLNETLDSLSRSLTSFFANPKWRDVSFFVQTFCWCLGWNKSNEETEK